MDAGLGWEEPGEERREPDPAEAAVELDAAGLHFVGEGDEDGGEDAGEVCGGEDGEKVGAVCEGW